MNNTFDEIDELLFKYFNSNKDIPKAIENKIRNVDLNAIKKENQLIKIIKKFIITIIGIITITGGMVFAQNIENFLKNFFGTLPNEGVDTAVNNGYVVFPNVEYQNADGIQIEIDSILIDDFNLCINFIMELNESYDIEEFKNSEISFEDLKIIDEKGNVIFVTHQYDKEHNYLGTYGFEKILIGERTFKISFTATNYSNPFPRNKKLNIDFNILNNNKYVHGEGIKTKFYNGKWHFEIDVPEEFYNRETIIYKVKSSNIGELTGVEALLTNTTFSIYIPEIISEKISYPKSDKDLHFEWKPFNEVYLETTRGIKFYGYSGIENSSGYRISSNRYKIEEYHQTFNLTSYDATDILKIHMVTNKNEDIIIELER